MHVRRAAKIIATIGPACDTVDALESLARAGADVLRVNTSHVTPEEAHETYERIDQMRERVKRPIAILCDLQGPKLRLGNIERRRVHAGAQVELHESRADSDDAPTGSVPVLVEGFAAAAKPGQRLVLGDGSPVLEVQAGADLHGDVVTRVVEPGVLRSRMGILLPDVADVMPALTDADRAHVAAAISRADFFALSFVSDAPDVYELRRLLNEHNSEARIVAKIERARAVENIDEIVDAADAVMVARGDLGLELGLMEAHFAQRRIIDAAQRKLKASVVATEVLESMRETSTPTRAEITDIARAIADGASALMLSAETAMGQHPSHVVRTMARYVQEAEERFRGDLDADPRNDPRAVTPSGEKRANLLRAADQLATSLDAAALIVPTDTGRTARWAAALSHRPVIALSSSPRVRRQLALEHSVMPVQWDGDHGESLPVTARAVALEAGFVSAGDQVVVAWGNFNSAGGRQQLIAAL